MQSNQPLEWKVALPLRVTRTKHFIAAVLLACGSSLQAQLLPPVEALPNGGECARGEILVQFTPTVTDDQIARIFRAGGLSLIKHVRTPAMEEHGQIGITHASTTLPVQQAIRALNNLPGVEFAEPNWIVRSQAESNDPLYLDGSLWGMFGHDYPSPGGTLSDD